MSRRVVTVAILSSGALLAITSGAATPDEAPEESRAQVDEALKALGRVMRGAKRTLVAGAPGSIEEVIAKFAPAKFHPVDEGKTPPRKKEGACPTEMALVAERVCVDRWEASLVTRKDDGTEEAVSPFESPPSGQKFFARSVAAATPQAYIKGPEALAACRASGKRLCEAAEWRAACGGSQGFAFPYGKKKEPRRCRDRGTAPMMVFHASTLKKGWGRTELNDPRLNQLPNTVSKTGSHEGCVNDYGLFDMVGNLHEWTADPNGTFQGGYYLDTAEHGEGCAYRTIAHPFDYSDYSIGFRCCSDPT